MLVMGDRCSKNATPVILIFCVARMLPCFGPPNPSAAVSVANPHDRHAGTARPLDQLADGGEYFITLISPKPREPDMTRSQDAAIQHAADHENLVGELVEVLESCAD
ncbi:hypothetical protein VZ52_02080 [Ralstonia mannitolilytica]|nr:hypothetical protein VZ52_02080 [Ralstonia mannitolilytica]